ncbi:hypothetical protein B9Z55_025283 [Caenorhabditis nigoni]|nr:hypothetical protein B9Z55_025283 [Caenorhabditis nigoni]
MVCDNSTPLFLSSVPSCQQPDQMVQKKGDFRNFSDVEVQTDQDIKEIIQRFEEDQTGPPKQAHCVLMESIFGQNEEIVLKIVALKNEILYKALPNGKKYKCREKETEKFRTTDLRCRHCFLGRGLRYLNENPVLCHQWEIKLHTLIEKLKKTSRRRSSTNSPPITQITSPEFDEYAKQKGVLPSQNHESPRSSPPKQEKIPGQENSVLSAPPQTKEEKLRAVEEELTRKRKAMTDALGGLRENLKTPKPLLQKIAKKEGNRRRESY